MSGMKGNSYLNESGDETGRNNQQPRRRAARYVGSVRYGFYVGLIPL